MCLSQAGCPRIKPSEMRICVQLLTKEVLSRQTSKGEGETKQWETKPGKGNPVEGSFDLILGVRKLWGFSYASVFPETREPGSHTLIPNPQFCTSVSHCSRVVLPFLGLCLQGKYFYSGPGAVL